MAEVQHGFHYAWESLLLDFEEILVGSGMTAQSAGPGSAPYFDRPFSLVKFFHHAFAEVALELRGDGSSAALSLFRQNPEERGESPGTEIGTVRVRYDEIIDMPDAVMERVYCLLAAEQHGGPEGRN